MAVHPQANSIAPECSRRDKLLDRIRKKLDDISDAQNEVASCRRNLLVQRETVRTTSRKVRLSRMELGNAEAIFMSRFREFAVINNIELPVPLRDAYEKVEQTRTFLGEMEANYLQMERDLTGAEWVFTDQETSFYQFDVRMLIPDDWDDEEDQPATQDITSSTLILPNVQTRLELDTHRPHGSAGTYSELLPEEIGFDIKATRRDLNFVLAELGTWQKKFQALRQKQSKRIDRDEA
ncbi:hypothetical protein T440DRAFT_405183, partial [Plenodomus tracheiphilus IPT5]